MATTAIPSRLPVLTRVLDVLLPPRCVGCGNAVAEQGGLCGACWSGLVFIGPPQCRICGYPLPHAQPADPLCGPCAADLPAFDRARSALRYDDSSRRLILSLKHRDRTHGVGAFAAWMTSAGAELLADADAILPVPLHRWRLLLRGYNQSALLAQRIGRESGVRMIADLLLRTRNTPSQQGLSMQARSENITAAAFRVHPRHTKAVDGRRLVLVDDVLTTGATVSACVRVLKRAGAAAVDVLALARVVRDGSG